MYVVLCGAGMHVYISCVLRYTLLYGYANVYCLVRAPSLTNEITSGE